MVFTRPAEPPPAPAPKPRKKRPNKREREAAKEAAMTPEQRAARDEDRRRFHKEMADAQLEYQRKEDERRKEAQRLADYEAALIQRAGIRWPGHVVDPAWIKEHGSVGRLDSVGAPD